MVPSDVVKKFVKENAELSWTYYEFVPFVELRDTATNKSVFLDNDAISVVRKLVLTAYWSGRRSGRIQDYPTRESEVAIHDVLGERARQISLWGRDDEREEMHSMYELYAILGEEVGEVAEAILKRRSDDGGTTTLRNVYKELSEVAAVAVRSMEVIQLMLFSDMDEDVYDDFKNQSLDERVNALASKFDTLGQLTDTLNHLEDIAQREDG